MTPRQRIATRLAFILITLAGGLLAIALTHRQSEASCSSCSGTFFGAYESIIPPSIGGTIWPQSSSNACAIADAIAIVNYDHLRYGYPLTFTSSSAQTMIRKFNQVTGQSQWGHATPTNLWGGITNIAPDFGNDPRSVAYMIKRYDLSWFTYHNYIYRWQFAHSTEPSFSTQAREATTLLARVLYNSKAPAVVFINGGLHSVVVTGMWSTENPNTHFPANITGLVYRDSEGSGSVSRQEVSISAWIGGGYANPFGVYSLWSRYYGDLNTVGDMKNKYDPEPTVGIYKPTSANPHHWYRGFTWVQRDAGTTTSVDLAINAVNVTVMHAP